jgi:phosphatidylglycerol:prolipoprotein diacylglycerol transferase
MFPSLIDFGTHELPLLGETHLFLPSYGMLFATATVLAWWWFMRRGRALEIAEEKLFNLSFYTILAGILGAKLALIVLDWRDYLAHPGALLGTLRSAGVLMGGVVAGAVTFVAYARREQLPLNRLLDAVVAPVALAQGIGRLGCFSAGCCWGTPLSADHPLGMIFTNPQAMMDSRFLGVPLFPTQLTQMLHDLALAGLLTWLWRRRVQPDGTVFWVYVIVYSIGRGVIEFWRGDVTRGMYFDNAVSTSQLIGLAAIAFGVTMLLRSRHKLRQGARGAPARAER